MDNYEGWWEDNYDFEIGYGDGGYEFGDRYGGGGRSHGGFNEGQTGWDEFRTGNGRSFYVQNYRYRELD